MNRGLAGIVLGLSAAMHPLESKAQQVPQPAADCVGTRASLGIPSVSDENLVAEFWPEGSSISLRFYDTGARLERKLTLSTEDELKKFLERYNPAVTEVYESSGQDQPPSNLSAIIHYIGDDAYLALDLRGKSGFADGCFEEYEKTNMSGFDLISGVYDVIFNERRRS